MCLKDSARPFMRPINAAVSCSLIFVFAFMTVVAPVVSAQDAQPIFTPSMTSGELRNTQRISLQVNDTNYTQPTIQVLDKDDAKPLPDDRVIKVVADKDATTVVLTWDTIGLPDAEYKIRYSATDQKGAIFTEDYLVSVANNKPIVTIAKTDSGRIIKGTVSRPDVTFAVTVDDVLLSSVDPTIALTPDNAGMYGWSFAVPDSVENGVQKVGVQVKPQSSDGAPATEYVYQDVTLTAPAVVTPPKLIPVQQLPPLELAPTIGQFIAPVIQDISPRMKTTLYGVPVTDLVQDQQDVASAVAVNGNEGSVLGSRQSSDSSASVVAATESGWKFFGIGWYWIVLIVAGAGLAYALYKRRISRMVYSS